MTKTLQINLPDNLAEMVKEGDAQIVVIDDDAEIIALVEVKNDES
jgi:hypothetical protein